MTQPALASMTKSGRVYKWQGAMYPSITTIIGGGVPKPALAKWGPKQVAKYVSENMAEVVADAATLSARAHQAKLKNAPWDYTASKGKIGDEVHAFCEDYSQGNEMALSSYSEAARPYCQGFIQFIHDWEPIFQFVEQTVVNKTFGYAGTFDFIAELPGIGTVLGDYKTSNGVWPEVGLQLAAIRYAEVMLLDNEEEVPMPQVDGCVEVHLLPDGDYELIPVRAGPDEFIAFRAAIAVRNFQEVTSKHTIGRPLLPPITEQKESA